MNDLSNLNLHKKPCIIGQLPTSYYEALSYEEQLFYIGHKTDEIIKFINDILEQKITEYIEQKFNDIMIDSMYEQETETLILFLSERS